MIRALWSGLKGRLILTYLAIFLVSAAIMAGRAGSLFARTTLASAERDLEAQAIVMASAFGHPYATLEGEDTSTISVPQLQSLTGRFARGAGGQLTILDRTGAPIATSIEVVPPNQGDQPEVSAAASGWVRHDVRQDGTSGEPMIYAAAPIQRSGQVVGVVQLSIPLSVVAVQSRQFWLSLGLTALFAALAAVIAGWWLAGELVHPVGRLRDAAATLAAGNLDERVPTGGVTEIAELAAAFNDMAGRVEDMINRQRAFVANASHELRTPLTNIKLRAEALNNGALDDAAVARRFVGEIESEANRLSRMAADLLALSRQDANAPVFREPLDVGTLAAEVVDDMRLRATKASVALTVDVTPELPVLPADPVAIRAVLVNLLDNAFQYTPSGGSVAVSVNPSQLDGRQAVALQVADSGEGIPAEDLPHIFDRFYRADKARSRRNAQRANGSALGSGAGLGLAIVRGIVEEHRGEVSAASDVGQGTTVTVTLPVDG